MTLGGFSWRGGTREYPHRQDDGREQSEEPPAEYWEQRGRQEENEQTDTYNITEERWIGEIVRVPHPASGHMGSSMGEVVDTKTSTANQRVEPLKDKPKDEREYEEYEYTILVVEDLISKQTYHTHQSGNPEASFAADGSTYSVYGIEQQKEDGEWNQIPFPNGAKWGPQPIRCRKREKKHQPEKHHRHRTICNLPQRR